MIVVRNIGHKMIFILSFIFTATIKLIQIYTLPLRTTYYTFILLIIINYKRFLTHVLSRWKQWKLYILILFRAFLLLTVAVYTNFGQLLNHYSRIMRHFALNLFIAFVVLACSNLMVKRIVETGLCKFIGRYI